VATPTLVATAGQGCQIDRFAVKFMKFGYFSGWLAVRLFLAIFWRSFGWKCCLLALFENMSMF